MGQERALNRVVRVTVGGWQMDADQKHADTIIEDSKLKEAKGVSSPCEEERRLLDGG